MVDEVQADSGADAEAGPPARAAGPGPPAEHPFEAVHGRDEMAVWDAIACWRAEGRRFALITVTETSGSTPRKPGAHMLVAEDGRTWGTLGGGAIEYDAQAAAREVLAGSEGARVVHRHLTQELGMCCGGEMSLLIENVESAPALCVFGAGHIGRALAALAAGCGFRVTVVDGRDEWADAARFPRATVCCRAPEEYAREVPLTPGDYAVVTTHDHGLDDRVVEELLRHPLAFLGMIGSASKQRKFALRLQARGFSDADIARLRTPLGLAIGAATPEEIAVSVMAEIIAVRRGVPVGPPGAPPPRHGEEASGARPAEARTPAPGKPSAQEVTRR